MGRDYEIANIIKEGEVFGDFVQYDRAKEILEKIFERSILFPDKFEYQRFFVWGAIRRTHSLALSFRQAVEARNGQMAATIIRLNLDTVARFYTLYWADDTEGMSAETYAKEVFFGKHIKDFKFQGSKEKAQDRWLIKKIEPLAPWISSVYENTSGAIHFSDFHIHEVIEQSDLGAHEDGGVRLHNISMSPIDVDENPERFIKLKQAFLHITLLLLCAIEDRCEILGNS